MRVPTADTAVISKTDTRIFRKVSPVAAHKGYTGVAWGLGHTGRSPKVAWIIKKCDFSSGEGLGHRGYPYMY